MAIKQQSSMHETNAQATLFSQSNNQHHQDTSEVHNAHVKRPSAKLSGLGLVSLIATIIAVQLTLMIVLISPRGPVAQKLIETAVIEPTVQDAPVTSTLEVPSQPTGDKRFMDGLEVEPAPPSVSDPFSVRGNKAK
jgi:hypothetical protein